MDLGMGTDRDEARTDRPAAIALVGHPGLTEELRVVVDEDLRLVRSDEDVVEVHGTPPVRSRWRSMVVPCPTTVSGDRSGGAPSIARRPARRSRTPRLFQAAPSCPLGSRSRSPLWAV